MEFVPGRRVCVYRNGHGLRWVVRDAGCVRVLGHTDALCLVEVEFTVDAARRQRMLASGRATLHAWVIGYPRPAAFPAGRGRRVSYDPRRDHGFVLEETGEPVRFARCVLLDEQGCFLAEE